MGFRLVPNSVILNDREGRDRYFALFLPNSTGFRTNYVKVVKYRPILSAQKCSPENLAFKKI